MVFHMVLFRYSIQDSRILVKIDFLQSTPTRLNTQKVHYRYREITDEIPNMHGYTCADGSFQQDFLNFSYRQ